MELKDRARDKFPQVMLTLLSIVQALALQFLWESMRDNPVLFQIDLPGAIGWLQILVSLLSIIIIWLLYVDLVMRFRITPRMADLVLPFILGLIEFYFVEIASPEWLGEWLITLAVLFLIFSSMHHRIMRRARRDQENKEFFDQVNPLSRKEKNKRILYYLTIAAIGAWFMVNPETSHIALIIVFVILARQFMALFRISQFWNISLAE
jgi:hypothetical protein